MNETKKETKQEFKITTIKAKQSDLLYQIMYLKKMIRENPNLITWLSKLNKIEHELKTCGLLSAKNERIYQKKINKIIQEMSR
ncbi:MAG: hypothetical protein ACLRFI_00290 [Alphaproteobacteria bacterium]